MIKKTALQPLQTKQVAKQPLPAKAPAVPASKKFGDAYSTGRAKALRSVDGYNYGAGYSNAPPKRPTAQAPSSGGVTLEGGGVSVTPTSVGGELKVDGGFAKEVKTAKGVGLRFGVDAEASVTSEVSKEDGVTTYTVSGEASVTLNGGVDAKGVSVSVAHANGIKASWAVALPDATAQGVNPASVNPFDPTSMPVGSSVTMDGSSYTSTEFSATFRNLAVSTKVTNEAGVSVAYEKVDANTVRVTAGPTEAIKNDSKIGFDFGVAKASVGRNDTLKEATLKTAEFDLSTTAGTEAYNHFLATGELPTTNGAGIANVATVEKLTLSSQRSIELGLGPLSYEATETPFVNNEVVTTLPDGTSTRELTITSGGQVPMQINQSFDAQGNERLDQRTYSYTVQATEQNVTWFNEVVSGEQAHDLVASDPIQTGDTVVLTLTEEEMKRFQGMAAAVGAENSASDRYDDLAADIYGKPRAPWDAAMALGTSIYSSNERWVEEYVLDVTARGGYLTGASGWPGSYTVS